MVASGDQLLTFSMKTHVLVGTPARTPAPAPFNICAIFILVTACHVQNVFVFPKNISSVAARLI
jgi:hypothetical protein